MKTIHQKTGVLLLTTEASPQFGRAQHLVAIHTHAIVGANVFRDLFAQLTDFFGGRSRGYERALDSAVEAATLELAKQAKQAGGNAVLGMRIEVSPVGRGMLMASCTGTAAVLPD